MRHRLTISTLGLVLAVAAGLAPAYASKKPDDCTVPHPSIDGSAPAEDTPADRARETLSGRLATCGSVLDPPSIGDTDIIEPAPAIGDPINIHPNAPDRNGP